jgi:hypothetical protein
MYLCEAQLFMKCQTTRSGQKGMKGTGQSMSCVSCFPTKVCAVLKTVAASFSLLLHSPYARRLYFIPSCLPPYLPN